MGGTVGGAPKSYNVRSIPCIVGQSCLVTRDSARAAAAGLAWKGPARPAVRRLRLMRLQQHGSCKFHERSFMRHSFKAAIGPMYPSRILIGDSIQAHVRTPHPGVAETDSSQLRARRHVASHSRQLVAKFLSFGRPSWVHKARACRVALD